MPIAETDKYILRITLSFIEYGNSIFPVFIVLPKANLTGNCETNAERQNSYRIIDLRQVKEL